MRPADDERRLRALDSLPLSELRPAFAAGLRQLSARIFHHAAPKKMGGSVLTGVMLAGLTRAYVDAINDGAVPTISTAWQSVVTTEGERAAALVRNTHPWQRALCAMCELSLGECALLKRGEPIGLNWPSRCNPRLFVLTYLSLSQSALSELFRPHSRAMAEASDVVHPGLSSWSVTR